MFTCSGSSWFASIFLVVNAALGAGLLNFPAAYHEAGGIVIAMTIQTVSNFSELHISWLTLECLLSN